MAEIRNKAKLKNTLIYLAISTV